MIKRNLLKTVKHVVISTVVPVFLFSMVQVTVFAAETTTGVTATVTQATATTIAPVVTEVNTLTFKNTVTKTGKIMVNFTDGDIRGMSIVPVVAGETAAQVAAKLPRYYNNYIVTPYYKVTVVGENVIFKSLTSSTSRVVKVTVIDANSTGVGALSSTQTTK